MESLLCWATGTVSDSSSSSGGGSGRSLLAAASICPQRAMRSKTWAIALAILSRLTVADCLVPPVHRSHPSAAERPRDPDGEIDDVYRMREELARENLLKHLKLPVENGISAATEVEYVDDEAGPRQRYEEKPPEMTNNYRQRPPVRTLPGPKNALAHHGHSQHRHGAPEKEKAVKLSDENEPETAKEHLIRTAPYVHIRSGMESFQPIAAAIAMQENLKALEDSAPPHPPLQPLSIKHVPTSAKDTHEIDIQPERPHPNIIRPTGSSVSENEVLRPEYSLKKVLEAKEVQAAALQQPQVRQETETASLTEVYFLAVVAGCSVAGFMGLVLAGVCYYRLRKKVKATSDVEYPAYGVTGPIKEREGSAPGDRKLAQSAQMYHYQHQKQQMIASERLNSDVNHRGSDAESEDENEEGDYTVFECPGLATNGDMEVRNPLFKEQTPVTAPSDISGTQGKK